MNEVLHLFNGSAGALLTWSLLHTLWEGLLIAVVLAIVLRLTPGGRAEF